MTAIVPAEPARTKPWSISRACQLPPGDATQDLCRWRRRPHPRRTHRVSRRERQARHRTLRDFTKTALKKRFASLDDFLKRWKSAERKQAIIEELDAEGLALDAVADELGKNLDPFDLICHVAFDRKPLTRRERAENVKKRDVFTKYGRRPARCWTRFWKNIATRAFSISTTPTC